MSTQLNITIHDPDPAALAVTYRAVADAAATLPRLESLSTPQAFRTDQSPPRAPHTLTLCFASFEDACHAVTSPPGTDLFAALSRSGVLFSSVFSNKT